MGWGRARVLAIMAAASTAVAGCGGGGHAGQGTPTPQALLSDAKAVIDRSPSVHFTLTSSGASGSGTVISGGSGDIARPDQLQGQFTVAQSGFTASVGVLAGGGKFYVKLPFQSSYSAANPSTYGIGNPADLIDPTKGLSSLLPAIVQPQYAAPTRIGAEIVDQVQGTVPGTAVPVLPDTDRSAPVSVVVGVVSGSHQLRRVTLRGPFTSATPSTYTVVLTDYGAAVHVALPSG